MSISMTPSNKPKINNQKSEQRSASLDDDFSQIRIQTPREEVPSKGLQRKIVYQTDIPFGFEVEKDGKAYLATFKLHIVRNDGVVNLEDGVVENIENMLMKRKNIYESGKEFIEDFEKYLKMKGIQFTGEELERYEKLKEALSKIHKPSKEEYARQQIRIDYVAEKLDDFNNRMTMMEKKLELSQNEKDKMRIEAYKPVKRELRSIVSDIMGGSLSLGL